MQVRLAIVAALVAVLSSASASAEDKMYPDPVKPWRKYSGVLPPCEDGKVFYRIGWAFQQKEREYWNSPLTITGFERVREIGFMPWGREFIPRRYCRAEAWISDGKRREVFYSIGEGLGEASIRWGVEWCVTGLDRNLAYAPHCKMAQP